MASDGLLREDEAAVNRHVEYAARRLDGADFGIGKGLLQLSRQTGGSGLIVSNDAILDGDEHGLVPPVFSRGGLPANRSGGAERNQGETDGGDGPPCHRSRVSVSI
jgi:hypothetical protein